MRTVKQIVTALEDHLDVYDRAQKRYTRLGLSEDDETMFIRRNLIRRCVAELAAYGIEVDPVTLRPAIH